MRLQNQQRAEKVYVLGELREEQETYQGDSGKHCFLGDPGAGDAFYTASSPIVMN